MGLNKYYIMDYKEAVKKRQEINQEILALIAEDPFIKEHLVEIAKCIKFFPEQRFGQIMCNYVCPSYRDYNPVLEEKECLARLFPDNPDPFFEESIETLNRLKK